MWLSIAAIYFYPRLCDSVIKIESEKVESAAKGRIQQTESVQRSTPHSARMCSAFDSTNTVLGVEKSLNEKCYVKIAHKI